jgi:hypothetical protein
MRLRWHSTSSTPRRTDSPSGVQWPSGMTVTQARSQPTCPSSMRRMCMLKLWLRGYAAPHPLHRHWRRFKPQLMASCQNRASGLGNHVGTERSHYSRRPGSTNTGVSQRLQMKIDSTTATRPQQFTSWEGSRPGCCQSWLAVSCHNRSARNDINDSTGGI